VRGTTYSFVIALALALVSTGCKKDGAAKPGERPSGKDDTSAPAQKLDPKAHNPVAAGAFDAAAFGKALDFDKLAERVMARADVDKAFDVLIEGVFADPKLGELGSQLGDKLGSDPEIAQGFAAITEAIGQDANLVRRLQKLVADRPGITQDQLMALFMEEFNLSFKTTLEKPIELAAQNAIKGLHVDKEANQLLAQVSLRLESSFTSYVEDPARIERWSKRLTELNNGQVPSTDRAAELFLQHALGEERLAKYMLTVLGDPVSRSEVARFLLAVGKAKPVETAVIQATRTVASDRAVQQAAVAAMASAFDPRTTPGVAKARVDALFATAAIKDGLDTVVKAFLTEPSVPTAIDDSLRALWATPSIKKATDELLDGW
jgi:hypothetical protein